jgi:signal transduction histidine kinase
MKQANVDVEPGVVRVLQVVALLMALFLPIMRRWFSTSMGIAAPLEQFLLITVPFVLVLNGFVWLPWPRRLLGSAFLPVTLVIYAIGAIVEKQLTINWLTTPQTRDLSTLLMTIRVWLTFQVIVLIVAWQYPIWCVVLVSLTLSGVDWLLGAPEIAPGNPLLPIYILMLIMRTFTVTGTGVVVGWLLQREREQRRALAEANHKLALAATTAEQLAVSQERNRMARELHDTLAHSLSGVTVQLEAVDALWEIKPGEARAMANQALHSTRTGLTEARRALQALRASPLEDLGLGLAISTLAQDAAARANLRLDLDVPAPLGDIPPDVEQGVYRVAQEALTNVVRHAHAQSVRVSLKREQGCLQLTVADDGRGFDPNAKARAGAANGNGAHYGLQGLRERAQMIGGTLTVDSQPHRGTTLQLTVRV